MRLTCPDCAAEYDIDPALIPAAGREVECAACGHHWHQPGSSRQPFLLGDPDLSPEVPPAQPAPPAAAPASAPRPSTPRPSPTVLEILREEAARELSQRGMPPPDAPLAKHPGRAPAAPDRVGLDGVGLDGNPLDGDGPESDALDGGGLGPVRPHLNRSDRAASDREGPDGGDPDGNGPDSTRQRIWDRAGSPRGPDLDDAVESDDDEAADAPAMADAVADEAMPHGPAPLRPEIIVAELVDEADLPPPRPPLPLPDAASWARTLQWSPVPIAAPALTARSGRAAQDAGFAVAAALAVLLLASYVAAPHLPPGSAAAQALMAARNDVDRGRLWLHQRAAPPVDRALAALGSWLR